MTKVALSGAEGNIGRVLRPALLDHGVGQAGEYAQEVPSRPNPLDALAQRYEGSGFVTQDLTPRDRKPGA